MHQRLLAALKARLFNNAAKDVIPEEDNKKKRKLDDLFNICE